MHTHTHTDVYTQSKSVKTNVGKIFFQLQKTYGNIQTEKDSLKTNFKMSFSGLNIKKLLISIILKYYMKKLRPRTTYATAGI